MLKLRFTKLLPTKPPKSNEVTVVSIILNTLNKVTTHFIFKEHSYKKAYLDSDIECKKQNYFLLFPRRTCQSPDPLNLILASDRASHLQS